MFVHPSGRQLPSSPKKDARWNGCRSFKNRTGKINRCQKTKCYLNPTDLKFCVHCHSIHSEIILLMVDHGPNIQYFWISPDYLEQHLSRNERKGKGGGENVFKNLTEPQSYVLYPCSMFKRSINWFEHLQSAQYKSVQSLKSFFWGGYILYIYIHFPLSTGTPVIDFLWIHLF